MRLASPRKMNAFRFFSSIICSFFSGMLWECGVWRLLRNSYAQDAVSEVGSRVRLRNQRMARPVCVCAEETGLSAMAGWLTSA